MIWNALPQTLEFIAANVRPGSRSLEIGAGASTVVFGAAGSHHKAISPVGHEHREIVSYCRDIGVSTEGLTFVDASSDEVLPGLETEPLDFVLLDGTHAFPFAVVEWHFLRRHLLPGGLFVLDDVPIPAVAPVYRFMQCDPDWELVSHLDRRTAAFRKLRETPDQTWRDQGLNRSYPDFSYLPARERIKAISAYRRRWLRSEVASRAPFLRALRHKLRARS